MEANPLFAPTGALKARLEEARERAARILGASPRRLLSDAALAAVLAARPATESELRAVKGVGLRAASVLARDVARIFGDGSALPDEPALAPLDESEPEELATEPEEPAVSVSAYLRALNDALGGHGAIVRGEVTEARQYPSGIWFSIKDATGQEGVLNCYLPPYRARAFGHLLEAGAELRVLGAPRIAPRKGSFSFQVEALELAGAGALRAAYERLRRDLAAEGLFARALPVPPCARRIGIVTSRAGAVIGDFRRNLEPRGYRLLMHDARVEGVRAVPSILEALSWFRKHADRVDVVVVMRGGGSLEDLQAFNSEPVARAIAALPVPVIAAVGHDRDEPIANMAADRSTSTPSVAAMLINQSWAPAEAALAFGTERLRAGAQGLAHRLGRRIDVASGRLAARSLVLVHRARERTARAASALRGILAALAREPDDLLARMAALLAASVARLGDRLLAYERELAIVDPERTLRLGYSILSDARGRTVRSVSDVARGDAVRARLADGTVTATVTDAIQED